jgi:ferric-dicitrate binding protein FerR (iron transport regulator)
MAHPTRSFCARFLLTALVVLAAGCGAAAEDIAWRVGKSSGEVWLTTSGVQQASLTDETILKPGDNVRTGRNGRALLVRGEETMLISPNSIIGIPAEQKNGLATTIIQQAGSVLFEVEKRNVKHFEVETPYLAAVVKGTQFSVSVTKYGANVGVRRGQVEVADFKSGQHALVLPGQTAKVSTLGSGGLSLGGAGKLSPIERGEPRRSSVNAVPVPAKGLTAPSGGSDGQTVRALRNPNGLNGPTQLRGADGALRIKLPLGEVNVNFRKVTNGLAREATAAAGERANAAKPTVWSSGELTPGNGVGKLYGATNGNAGGNGNASGNSSAAANGNAVGNGNGIGNGIGNVIGIGNNGNGIGNGNGVGNGIGNGIGNGFLNGVGTTNPNANAHAHKP